MAHFVDLLGPTVATKSGLMKPTAEALEGKEVVGLYFSAHWCGPCRAFTPQLASTYTAIMGAGKAFEIVFISSDRDEGSFDSYWSEQPWPALPYAARGEKAALSRKYKVQGIPTLVLLDGKTGKVLTTDGREVLSSDAEGFPWPQKSVLDLLGGADAQLLTSPAAGGDGDDVRVGELWGKKKLGVYFSAHWCPPCKAFTPKLIEVYKALKQSGRDDFEFVFVSSDRSTNEFSEYFGSQPWLGIPPGDPRKAALSRRFGVEGIPTFVMLDERGATINANARGAVMADPTGARFPWAPEPAADLEDGPDGLNETPSVVALLEGLDEAAQREAIAAVIRVAKATRESSRAAGEDESPFCFFYATAAANVTLQVRKLTGQPASAPKGHATLLLLDIPDDGGYYVGDAHDVTDASLKALLADYGAKKLTRQQMA
ncbi:hypothetical protein KFE25_003971 [Diacronema lutheri]|uniref:Thioredoxin domain-containing protein n=1 Tax=Diacronema lutheri TaxID=2081491 RepID=A0A8J5XBT9_DIALT|nr:hypothetical protein KFE25_003971 [Diacronema lutheri]